MYLVRPLFGGHGSRFRTTRDGTIRIGPVEPAVPEKVGKELQAFYVGDSAPRIDGRLDDEGWQTAQAIDDMVQNDPEQHAAADRTHAGEGRRTTTARSTSA